MVTKKRKNGHKSCRFAAGQKCGYFFSAHVSMPAETVPIITLYTEKNISRHCYKQLLSEREMVNICRNMLLGSRFITRHFIKRGGLTSTVFIEVLYQARKLRGHVFVC